MFIVEGIIYGCLECNVKIFNENGVISPDYYLKRKGGNIIFIVEGIVYRCLEFNANIFNENGIIFS